MRKDIEITWKCPRMEFTPELVRGLLVHAQFNAVFNNYTDIKKKKCAATGVCIVYWLCPVYKFNG